MKKDLIRRINLNNEFNPRITEYNNDVTNKINPITGHNYLENFSGVPKTRIRIGMGQIGRSWDEGEIFPSLSDYLHLQTVLGTMDKADDIFEVRESFEYLVKNLGKLQMGINSINTVSSLENSLNSLKNLDSELEVETDPYENQYQ
jgi:hypothetical protein